MSGCQCRKKADAALLVHNTRIKRIYSLGSSGALGMPWPIETEQVEKGRGKAKAMGLHASYCPLCGASLNENDNDEAPLSSGAEGA